MTICIGAIAENKYVVMAADRTLTLSLIPEEFGHEHSSKLYDVDKRCVIGTAGSPVFVPHLLRLAKERQKKGKKAEVVECFTKALIELRRKRIEDVILRKYTWDYSTFENYYSSGLILAGHARKILEGMEKYHVCVHVVLGFVTPDGEASIYRIEDPGESTCFDSMGFYTVGSGEGYALQTLVRASYTADKSLPKSLFTVYEAKKNAEQAIGVGRRTDIRIISKKGIARISDEDLQGLNKIYEAKEKRIGRITDDIEEKTRQWLPENVKSYIA